MVCLRVKIELRNILAMRSPHKDTNANHSDILSPVHRFIFHKILLIFQQVRYRLDWMS